MTLNDPSVPTAPEAVLSEAPDAPEQAAADPPPASLARAVALLGGGFLLAVLGTICVVMTVMLMGQSQERTVAWVDAKVASVAESLDTHDQTARLLVERFAKVFADQFGKNFTLDEAGGRLMQLGIALNGYDSPCDKFLEFTGGEAAVLMKQAGSFVSVSTSMKDAAGERARSWKVAPGHPAHAAISKGETWSGRVSMYGRAFALRVQPVRDLQSNVVGALAVAFDLADFDKAVERGVDAARFFDTGVTYVVEPAHDGQPATVVAPARLRGAHADTAGADGSKALSTVLAAATPGTELRGFHALAGQAGDERFAVARRSAATGRWVVGEASRAEALRGQWRTLAPFLLLFALAAGSLVAGLYILLRRRVGQPLRAVTEALARVAAGDLSQPVEARGRDEIGVMGRAVEAMRLRFVEMLGEVRVAAGAVATASSEVAAGNLDLSQRTEEAAARLQEATASMDVVHANLQASADDSRQANALASAAAEAANRGQAAVDDLVARMDRLSSGSKRIAEIVGVIDGLAFQTNLLALNAAVEAARAGEMGRGFGVVAGEVRSLAKRCATAAKEIEVQLTTSVQEIQGGHQLAGVVGKRMQDLVGGVREVHGSLASIASRMDEQSAGLGDVAGSVTVLDRMTQQNAALVEQSSSAAESLNAQAARLVQIVNVFRLEA